MAKRKKGWWNTLASFVLGHETHLPDEHVPEPGDAAVMIFTAGSLAIAAVSTGVLIGVFHFKFWPAVGLSCVISVVLWWAVLFFSWLFGFADVHE